MAERVLPAPPRPPPPPPSLPLPPSTVFGSPLDRVLDTGHDDDAKPARPHETYIVQVPKDQIYRVPPPENAYLAERYASKQAAGKRRRASPCILCLFRTLGVALAICVLLAIGLLVFAAVLRPAVPSFTVDELSIRNSSRAGQPYYYEVFLTAHDPNKVGELSYGNGGVAKLSSQGAAVANGSVAEANEGGANDTEFTLELHGVHGALPKAVEKGLKVSNESVAFKLSVELHARVRVGAIEFGRKSLTVDCEMKVAGLKKETRIASQKCKSSF